MSDQSQNQQQGRRQSQQQQQLQRTQSSQQGQQQNGDQDGDDEGSGEESGPEIPYIEEPKLDRTGNTSQRTVEQKQKQEELVKKDRRIKGIHRRPHPSIHPPDPVSSLPQAAPSLTPTGIDTNRSRSSSRRDRRKRIQSGMTDGRFMHTNKLEALEEADANGELKAMRPFERIGPDSTSMDGPVTMARAERGEIPLRGTNPAQPYYKKPQEREKTELDEADGMKLSLEANLDIEIELKASIRGDVTLALL